MRPWLFWLLIGLGGATGLLILLWLAWHILIWRPNVRPNIVLFDTTSQSLRENGQTPLTLNWDIENPDRVSSLSLSWKGREHPVVYNLQGAEDSRSIPSTLAAYCRLDETVSPNNRFLLGPLSRFHRQRRTGTANLQVLQCRDVPVEDFDQVQGTYDFRLRTYRRHNAQGLLTSKQLDQVVIDAADPPSITHFSAESIAYCRENSGLLQPVLADNSVGQFA